MRFAASLAFLLAAPLAAQAPSAEETLRVFAEAAPGCIVSDASAPGGGTNAVFTADGSGGGTIAISQLVDPQTAEPRASAIEVTLPVVCNAAHRLTVTSTDGGLLRAGGQRGNALSQDGFADLVPYKLAIDWAGTTLQGSSQGGAIATAQSARAGEMRLRVATDQGGGALTAGRYGDSITIRFEPAS